MEQNAVEMKIGGTIWLPQMRAGWWRDNLTVHRGDESGKKRLQFHVGQNNVRLSDGGKKRRIGSETKMDKTVANQFGYWQGHVVLFHPPLPDLNIKAKYLASAVTSLAQLGHIWSWIQYVGLVEDWLVIREGSQLNTFLRRPWYNRLVRSKHANE